MSAITTLDPLPDTRGASEPDRDEPDPEPEAGSHRNASAGEGPEIAQGCVLDAQLHDAPAEAYEELSDEWLAWCAEAGQCSVPALVSLHDRVPQITAAMLCTLDGFNICAIGIDQDGVGRAAAVASSLQAVASAATGQCRARGSFDYLSVVAGDQTTVYTTVMHGQLGQLLLWARATNVALGVLLLAVRTTAAGISKDLTHLSAALPAV